MPSLVWFRDDLRRNDHPALSAGATNPEGVIALYVLDEESSEMRPLGGAAKWWLHHSLRALAGQLAQLGIPLVLRRGPARRVVPEVAAETGASHVLWNRRYGPGREIDAELKERFTGAGIAAESFAGDLLHEPWLIRTQGGTPYRVFTPFWRACQDAPAPAAPIPAPVGLTPAAATPLSEDLEDWHLRPSAPDWAREFGDRWEPGERAAAAKLEAFLEERVENYAGGRDIPAEAATSDLSPHLRWGEISPRQVWHGVQGDDASVFLSEIGWREFAWHTLYHNPDLHRRPLDRRFENFPWQEVDPGELRAWQAGETGYGLVDAGMQELWRSGTMHNRVRMVTASFLTKNLLTDWRIGEAWFWDTLVDADPASNPFNWQWVAGCGADAAPYFRIFNPRTQEERFDPHGAYVGMWAPDSRSHEPLVDLRETRARALAAFEQIKGT